MSNLNIICDEVKINDKRTEILFDSKSSLYTVSDMIALFEAAKEKWGDREVVIYNSDDRSSGGFFGLFLEKGFSCKDCNGDDFVEEDKVSIYM